MAKGDAGREVKVPSVRPITSSTPAKLVDGWQAVQQAKAVSPESTHAHVHNLLYILPIRKSFIVHCQLWSAPSRCVRVIRNDCRIRMPSSNPPRHFQWIVLAPMLGIG